ncbi:RmlC-like cupin family protein [Cavenderia fasciculata]|uniref:RmlC-like cupin family protein n=1 Tax=Cavenderia fasciculata TaxID=261658 RepID=F4PWQ4_CACFS|nr:RmlC-like cupin family protein [Cavenderia fasciculata]EGG20418.1 RmlC-like cupin family protein [Cavenderia fasciculata]|eukprot:XP_004367401.1 RmlC-like cupin family protein [Cavenderia fasciculata]
MTITTIEICRLIQDDRQSLNLIIQNKENNVKPPSSSLEQSTLFVQTYDTIKQYLATIKQIPAMRKHQLGQLQLVFLNHCCIQSASPSHTPSLAHKMYNKNIRPKNFQQQQQNQQQQQPSSSTSSPQTTPQPVKKRQWNEMNDDINNNNNTPSTSTSTTSSTTTTTTPLKKKNKEDYEHIKSPQGKELRSQIYQQNQKIYKSNGSFKKMDDVLLTIHEFFIELVTDDEEESVVWHKLIIEWCIDSIQAISQWIIPTTTTTSNNDQQSSDSIITSTIYNHLKYLSIRILLSILFTLSTIINTENNNNIFLQSLDKLINNNNNSNSNNNNNGWIISYYGLKYPKQTLEYLFKSGFEQGSNNNNLNGNRENLEYLIIQQPSIFVELLKKYILEKIINDNDDRQWIISLERLLFIVSPAVLSIVLPPILSIFTFDTIQSLSQRKQHHNQEDNDIIIRIESRLEWILNNLDISTFINDIIILLYNCSTLLNHNQIGRTATKLFNHYITHLQSTWINNRNPNNNNNNSLKKDINILGNIDILDLCKRVLKDSENPLSIQLLELIVLACIWDGCSNNYLAQKVLSFLLVRSTTRSQFKIFVQASHQISNVLGKNVINQALYTSYKTVLLLDTDNQNRLEFIKNLDTIVNHPNDKQQQQQQQIGDILKDCVFKTCSKKWWMVIDLFNLTNSIKLLSILTISFNHYGLVHCHNNNNKITTLSETNNEYSTKQLIEQRIFGERILSLIFSNLNDINNNNGQQQSSFNQKSEYQRIIIIQKLKSLFINLCSSTIITVNWGVDLIFNYLLSPCSKTKYSATYYIPPANSIIVQVPNNGHPIMGSSDSTINSSSAIIDAVQLSLDPYTPLSLDIPIDLSNAEGETLLESNFKRRAYQYKFLDMHNPRHHAFKNIKKNHLLENNDNHHHHHQQMENILPENYQMLSNENDIVDLLYGIIHSNDSNNKTQKLIILTDQFLLRVLPSHMSPTFESYQDIIPKPSQFEKDIYLHGRELSRCLEVIKSLLVNEMSYWFTEKSIDDPRQSTHFEQTCLLIQILVNGQFIKHPLSLVNELFAKITPEEITYVLMSIWNFIKTNQPSKNQYYVKTNKDSGETIIEREWNDTNSDVFMVALKSIFQNHINDLCFMYSRFFVVQQHHKQQSQSQSQSQSSNT